jgi:hypothetical protein
VNAPALRPLGIGEILDVGIKIYWRNAWTLFRIVLFVVLPAQIIVGVIQVSALPAGVDSQNGSFFGPRFTSSNPTISGHDATILAVGVFAALVINALAGKFAQAGCFRAVADAYLGEPVSWRASLRFALRRLPAVVAVSLLSTILIAIGVVLCVIPGIYLWGAYYVAVPVVLVEGAGPIRALGRSRDLVSGRWWSTIGVALVGSVLVFVVAGAFSALILGVALASPAQNTVTGFVLNTVATTLSAVVTTPVAAAFAIVLYVDLRVRKEGFDLLLLAQRLGIDPVNAEAGAASLLPPPAQIEGEQPPFWPPPPGWKPSGNLPPVEPVTPVEDEPPNDQPPFWPPPPGWKPGGE